MVIYENIRTSPKSCKISVWGFTTNVKIRPGWQKAAPLSKWALREFIFFFALNLVKFLMQVILLCEMYLPSDIQPVYNKNITVVSPADA